LDCFNECRRVDPEPGEQVFQCLADCGGLRFQSLHYLKRGRVIDVLEEQRRPLRSDRMRRQRGAREILDVLSDDQLSAGVHGGSKNMSIFGMVCHLRNQMLITVNSRFREIAPNFGFAVQGLFVREAELHPQGSAYLSHDLIRPLWLIETRACRQPKQGVRQRHGDTRIQYDRASALHLAEPPSGMTFRS